MNLGARDGNVFYRPVPQERSLFSSKSNVVPLGGSQPQNVINWGSSAASGQVKKVAGPSPIQVFTNSDGTFSIDDEVEKIMRPVQQQPVRPVQQPLRPVQQPVRQVQQPLGPVQQQVRQVHQQLRLYDFS